MTTFAPLPLGQRIPASQHGVSCSLPTMRAVVGYEERDPEILRHLTSGYPRFVIHPFVRQLSAIFSEELELDQQTLWLTASARTADDLATELGAAHVIRIAHDGLHGVAHPASPELFSRAKTFLQNTVGFLGSREAEDHLVRRGILPQAQPEATEERDPLGVVIRSIQTGFAGTQPEDIILAPSGMSAFHAAWRTVADLQASRGRTVWLQLGWLYLDTIALLKRYAKRPSDYVYLRDVTDVGAIAAACAAAGDRLAGLVTEAPTNPLVQTPDLDAVSAHVRRCGGRLVIDPTLVSPLNVDVLPHADVVVNSLTKYAASEGDVLAGAVVINPAGPDAAFLRNRITHRTDSIYHRDLARLAAQIGDYAEVIARTNATTPAVAAFLEHHAKVKQVFWSHSPATRSQYLKLARSPEHVGAIISFSLHTPLTDFYDRLRLPKGPSFGMKTTLICPFIYLAHYDLVTSDAGRTELAASGIDPNLLRLSIGCEPADEIIGALAEALA
ncbi:MAG TPA: PLP-dependent transferase [Candidatus Synoicihabitans sp.]|nr:PLP-dependent transferase [Candidatus Synoicihabitans sp.]